MVESARDRDRLDQEAARLTELAARLAQQGRNARALKPSAPPWPGRSRGSKPPSSRRPEAYDEPRHVALRQQIAALEPLALSAERLRAADRASDLVRRAALAEQELSRLEAHVRTLRDRLRELGWSAEAFAEIRERGRSAERAVQQAELGKARAAGELTAALGLRAEVARRREERSGGRPKRSGSRTKSCCSRSWTGPSVS